LRAGITPKLNSLSTLYAVHRLINPLVIIAPELVLDESHPIVARICAYAASQNPRVGEFLRTSLFFFSPKTLVITQGGLGGLKQHASEAVLDINEHKPLLADPGALREMIDVLCGFFRGKASGHRIAIDLRGNRIIDATALEGMVAELAAVQLRPALLLSPNMQKYLTPVQPAHVSHSFEDLRTTLAEESFGPADRPTLTLSGDVTLAVLEGVLQNRELREGDQSCVLKLDLRKVRNIDAFALFSLRLLLYSMYRLMGAAWEIVRPEDPGLDAKLSDHGFYEIERSVAWNWMGDALRQPNSINSPPSAWTAMVPKGGDMQLFRKAVDAALHALRASYGDRLDEYRPISYARKHSSEKPSVYRLPISAIIRWLVTELAENALRYSEGPLHFSMSTARDVLSISLGDLGIGIRAGILRNYELQNDVRNNTDAVKIAFELPDHANQRKHKEDPGQIGAGHGLSDSLGHVFRCHGRLILRTGRVIGAFVNPVSRSALPTKIENSNYFLLGTQFFMLIPLTESAQSGMPTSTQDFISYRDWSER
jgi:ABC-type transporter Mla MlaB component